MFLHNKKALLAFLDFTLSTRGGNRTRTLLPELDFESSASTNSATRAKNLRFYTSTSDYSGPPRAFPFAENWCAKLIISTEPAKYYAEICWFLSILLTTCP